MAVSKSSFPVLDCCDVGLKVIDQNLDTEQMRKFGGQLVESFSSIGVCYLSNHGIPEKMFDGHNENLREFFIQPREIKEKYERGEKVTGWMESGTFSTNPKRPFELRDVFGFSPGEKIEGRNIWPNDKIKRSCKEVFETFQAMALRLCDCLSLGLGLHKSAIRDAHKFMGSQGNRTVLGSNFYPAIEDEASIKPGQIRNGEHIDTSIITLLWQDDIGGLEAELPGQGFVPVTPRSGTIVVVTGGQIDRLSSDRMLGIRHRVVIPETDLRRRVPRWSLAFFVQPDDDYVVKPLDGSDKYPPITAIEYLKMRLKELEWKFE